MELFELGKDQDGGRYTAVCEWKKTRNGFKHEATLLHNGQETRYSAKICYWNRTWERFEFESVLKKLIDYAKEQGLEVELNLPR